MSKSVEGGIPMSSGSAGPSAKVKLGLDEKPGAGPDATTDVNFAAVAPIKHKDETGKDTYVGIPGDGIVPGY